jgi:hypothetical protein
VIVDQDFAEIIGDQLESAVIEEPHPPLIIMPTFDRDAPPRLGSSRAARRALGLEQKDHPR